MQTRTRKSSTRVDAPPTRPPGAPITAEEHARARAAYIEHGTVASVRAAIGCGLDVANRLIDSGDPKLNLPSLRDCARAHAATIDKGMAKLEGKSASDQALALSRSLEARVAIAKEARQVEVAAAADALKGRRDETKLVRMNRHSALVLGGVNADLLAVAGRLGKSLLADVSALERLPARERMGLLRTIAGIVQRTAQSSAAAVTMERLLMGKPTSIVEHHGGTNVSTEDMTVEEAEQWLGLATKAFARRARRRTVIDAKVVGAGESDEQVDDLLEELDG